MRRSRAVADLPTCSVGYFPTAARVVRPQSARGRAAARAPHADEKAWSGTATPSLLSSERNVRVKGRSHPPEPKVGRTTRGSPSRGAARGATADVRASATVGPPVLIRSEPS